MNSIKVVCQECHTVNALVYEDESGTYLCQQCQADLADPFPIEVDDEATFAHIAQNDIPLIVDFYSTVCGPCMAMYEDYEDAALAFGLKVRFLKIDVDKHQEVAKKYGLTGVPTLIAFYQGQEVNRISEALTQTELTMWAESLLEL